MKEMRLAGISTIAAANEYLPGFWERLNRRFSVLPRSEVDAHRPVLHSEAELNLIFTLQNERTLSKTLTLQYHNQVYQVQVKAPGRTMRGTKVTVCESLSGQITLLYDGRSLDYTVFGKGERPRLESTTKQLNALVDQIQQQQKERKAWKPASDHPWHRKNRSLRTGSEA